MPRVIGFTVEGAKLKQLREEKLRMTARELGDVVERSEGAIRAYEREAESTVPARQFERLAKLMKVDVLELHKSLAPQRLLDDGQRWFERGMTAGAQLAAEANIEPLSEQRIPEIPTFDLSVAAGAWTDVSEVGEVMRPGQIDHGFFRVRIRGDSMQPVWLDGETVEFRCMKAGRDQLEVGQDYYVQRTDGTATFKRLHRVTNHELEFRAINRDRYREPLTVVREEVTRMALALHVIMAKRGG